MATSAEDRTRRHGVIRTLLRRRKVRSQAELGAALSEAGHGVVQSTLCRDLRDLGIAKVDGVYRLPTNGTGRGEPTTETELHTPGRRAIARYVLGTRPAGANLLVVRCALGTASAVGLAIDAEGIPEVVGTIAGDDTLFIATANRRDQTTLAGRLRALAATRTEVTP